MTRNLLALFALLSGLAALSGAGSAAYAAPSPSCNACLSASDIEATEQAQNQAGRLARNVLCAKAQSGQQYGPSAPIQVRKPVVMGVERSHE